MKNDDYQKRGLKAFDARQRAQLLAAQYINKINSLLALSRVRAGIYMTAAVAARRYITSKSSLIMLILADYVRSEIAGVPGVPLPLLARCIGGNQLGIRLEQVQYTPCSTKAVTLFTPLHATALARISFPHLPVTP